MSVNLVIRDGEPYWWNSPDIWVVPGNDPGGPPGPPIAGEVAFLWGRVRNSGDDLVLGACVNFYWSNPAAGVSRSNSTLVGSAFVDLDPKETKEVLCTIPWVSQIVNEGHECVVIEVIHPSDPLKPSPPPDEFIPPNYHQIAQKNLTVLAMKKDMIVQTIQLAASMRKEKVLEVETEIGGTLDRDNLVQAGLEKYRPAKDDLIKVGLSLEPGCGNSDEEPSRKRIKFTVRPGTARATYLKIWPHDLEPMTYLLLHVISRDEQRVVGGITYILIRAKED